MHLDNTHLSSVECRRHLMTMLLVQPAGGGPTITNCTIMNTGDDAIAVHGMYEMVAKVQTAAKPYPTVTVGFWSCADPSCLPINVNNTVLIYSPKLQNLGTAVVSSITATSNPGTINGTSPNAPAVSQASFHLSCSR